MVQKVLIDAFNIIAFENDSADTDSPKHENIKRFWSFVKSLKKDALGITPLNENGILKTDTKEKANICNGQFQAVYTCEAVGLPSKGPPWRR